MIPNSINAPLDDEKKKPSFFDGKSGDQPEQQEQQQQQQAAVNPYEAPNPTRNTQRAQTIIDRIYSTPVPEMQYDKNRPEEISRIAKVNAVGNLFKTAADAFSLSRSGNVVRREPDKTNENLLKNLWQYRDEKNAYENKKRWQEYQQGMQKGLQELDQLNRDTEHNFHYWKHYEDTNYRKERDKIADKRYDEAKDENLEFRKDQLEWQKKLPYIRHDLTMKEIDARSKAAMDQYLAKQAAKLSDENDKGGFDIFGNDGKRIASVSDSGSLQKAYALISRDPELLKDLKDKMKLMGISYGQAVTKDHMKVIVADFAEKSPKVRDFLNGINGTETPQENRSSGLNWNQMIYPNVSINPNPTWGAPNEQAATPEQNTPEQQPVQPQEEQKPSYSTGGYY